MFQHNEYDPNFQNQKVFCIVGVKAILQNEHGEILLLKRSPKIGQSGKWNFPGGGLELQEDPLQGIQREIWEETELSANQLTLFSIQSRTNSDSDFTLIIAYRGKVESNAKITINWEHDEYKWFNIEEARKLPNLTETTKFFIEKL